MEKFRYLGRTVVWIYQVWVGDWNSCQLQVGASTCIWTTSCDWTPADLSTAPGAAHGGEHSSPAAGVG